MADEYDEAVNSFVARENAYIPVRAEHYDWYPFLRALSEGNMVVGGINRIRFGTSRDRIQIAMMQRDEPPPIPTPRVPKAPNTGSWDYTWYIPEWSHPDYDPSVVVNFPGEVRHLSHRDPITRLYPALRAADAVRGPTEWAKRFGIHPEETGGRSRLSPSLSATRDPFDYFANQVNMLSEDSRRRAIEASRVAAYKAGGPIPTDPNYVDPNVLEELLSEHKVLSGRVVREKLQQVLSRPGDFEDITNLETFIQGLNAQSPDTYKFHQQFLENALHDQDYQRFIFNNLTSDEIVTNNFFNTSGGFFCNLDNPLHPLLSRQRWCESDWKGAIRREPRYLYSMDGARLEWDILNNDAIWNAIRPALQLVSLVLNSEHPMLHMLSDMANRQPVAPERDNRSDPDTPWLWAFHPKPSEGYAIAPLGVAELAASGFNWPKETWDTLGHCLDIDIVSGHLEIKDDASDLVRIRENRSFGYGSTRTHYAGPDSRIHITLSAELLWPLLVQQYNGSEKLTASFQIASTLIHELGHAIIQAHALITAHPEWAQYMGYDDLTRDRLIRLGAEVWDSKLESYEPYRQDASVSECGFELEKAVWGFPVFNLLQYANLNQSRQLYTVPFLASHVPWPYANTAAREDDLPVKGASFPIVDYYMPIPIDYMAKFFRKQFWQTDFVNYGFEALKLTPGSHSYKTIMMPERFDHDRGNATFGVFEWQFLCFVTQMLSNNEFVTLSEYVVRSMWMVMLPGIYVDRWTKEMGKWQVDWMAELDKSVEELRLRLLEAKDISQASIESDQGLTRRWQQYVVNTQGSGGIPMSLQDWTMQMKVRLTQLFCNGGELMRLYLTLYRKFMDEIRYMQRLIFDCFNLHPDSRQHLDGYGTGVTRGWQAIPPVKEAYVRMLKERQRARWFYGTLNGICNINHLVALKPQYQEWVRRFQYCWKLFDELIKMMDNPPAPDSDDRSWKKRFSTVPSSYWKASADRIQILAQREYVRVDPRIRSVIDDCMQIIRNSGNKALLKEPFVIPDVHALTEAMRKASAPEPLPETPHTIFSWHPPTGEQRSDDANQVPPVLQNPSTSAPRQVNTGLVFGQPGQLGPASRLGAIPARRNDDLPAIASDTGFNTWAAKTGFPEYKTGAPKISFGTGGAMNVPPGGSQFTKSGHGTLFPAPGADANTLTSDVQYFNDTRIMDQWEFNMLFNPAFRTNQGYRDVVPPYNDDDDEEEQERARQHALARRNAFAGQSDSPSAFSPPNYAPTPYISPEYLPGPKSPGDAPDFSGLFPTGPPINADDPFGVDPATHLYDVFSDVDFEAIGAATMDLGNFPWNPDDNDPDISLKNLSF